MEAANAVHLKRCAVFFFLFPCYDGDRKKKERTKHMGYILELRKQVGHRPLIMTCAGVLLLNEKRELLLQKRADNGLWGYPWGSMELGDSFEDCARREVQEETGLICGNLEHFMNVSGEEVHYVYPNGDEIYAAEEIFLCRKFSGQIICQQEEVEKLCFFRMDELPSKEQINPNNYPAIERLRRMMDENCTTGKGNFTEGRRKDC